MKRLKVWSINNKDYCLTFIRHEGITSSLGFQAYKELHRRFYYFYQLTFQEQELDEYVYKFDLLRQILIYLFELAV